MPELTINEKIVRFTGGVSTDKDLSLGDDVAYVVRGSVVKIEEGNNQDGTKDKTFKVKVLSIEDEE